MDVKLVINRIEALLKEQGISKENFYKSCNITSAAYSQWNTGKTVPREKSLRRIAAFLGVSYEYLTTGDTTKNGPAEDDEANELMREMYERPELRALFNTAKGVKREDIQIVDDMLKRFKEGYRDD